MQFIPGAKLLSLLTILFSVAIDNARSCSCALSHPQEEFCSPSTDAVMLIKTRSAEKKWTKNVYFKNPDGKINYGMPPMIHYYTRIRKIFKLKDNTTGVSKDSDRLTIVTPSLGSLCGVELKPNTKYLVSGVIVDGKLDISLCSVLTKDWRWVSLVQKKNLRYLYETNCDCEILSNNDVEANQVVHTSCFWSKISEMGKCQERHSACILDKNSTTGGCKWQRNRHMKECMAEAKGLKQRLP